MEPAPVTAALPANDQEAIALLAKMRWPKGFRCRCGYRKHWRIILRPRVFACRACSHHTSVTAGTALERTRIPLASWFLAARLISQPGGCSAASLQRQIGTCYETAWRLMHRLREAMVDPLIRLKNTPLISGLAIWCQHPGREQVGGGVAWVWAASDGEKSVTRFSPNMTAGRLLAAQHSDSRETSSRQPNAAAEHLRQVSLQTHITHRAVSQRWLARYLREIDFRANHLLASVEPAAAVLRAAIRRKYRTFRQLIPELWCPPTRDLEGPFLGDIAELYRLVPPPPPGRGLRRRDIPR